MKALKVLLRRVGVCFIFALAAGVIFIKANSWICGVEFIENSVGGGAAVGIVAIYVAYYAWPLSFVGLTVIDFARYLWILKRRLSLKIELVILAVTFILWTAVAIWIVKSVC